mgnify:FL=1
MAKTQTVQDQMLQQLMGDEAPVTVFLVNGFQLRGRVTGYDSFVVLLNSDGKQQMIYKHAISTIAPAKPVALRI